MTHFWKNKYSLVSRCCFWGFSSAKVRCYDFKHEDILWYYEGCNFLQTHILMNISLSQWHTSGRRTLNQSFVSNDRGEIPFSLLHIDQSYFLLYWLILQLNNSATPQLHEFLWSRSCMHHWRRRSSQVSDGRTADLRGPKRRSEF